MFCDVPSPKSTIVPQLAVLAEEMGQCHETSMNTAWNATAAHPRYPHFQIDTVEVNGSSPFGPTRFFNKLAPVTAVRKVPNSSIKLVPKHQAEGASRRSDLDLFLEPFPLSGRRALDFAKLF